MPGVRLFLCRNTIQTEVGIAMKIAVVSGMLFSVPPKGKHYLGYEQGFGGGYGGESQCHSLVRALCRAGHTVELFATGGSIKPERGSLHMMPSGDWQHVFATEKEILKMYGDVIAECDIVHDWTLTKMVHHWLMLGNKKVVQTPWGTGAPPPFYKDKFANTVCWSDFQLNLFLQQGYPETTKYLHGAVEPAMFEYGNGDGGFILYLSRTHPTKHPEIVIALARELGFRLVIACDTELPDHIYYLGLTQQITRNMPNIEYVIDPTYEQKEYLYRNAKAFILPSESECFGLVVIEALAHGTPVILARDGSYPEIIEHGTHGFLCKKFEEYVNAVKMVDSIDRRGCRRLVEEKFNSDLMAKSYVEIYEQVLQGRNF